VIQSIEILLDFPQGLSVNGARRSTIASRTGHEAEDRERAKLLTAPFAELPAVLALATSDCDIELTLTLSAPDLRHRDLTNAGFVLKPQLDGICDSLKIDDSRFNPVIARRGSAGLRGPAHLPGAVVVRLTWE